VKYIMYGPAWQEYCERKDLPANWGGPAEENIAKERMQGSAVRAETTCMDSVEGGTGTVGEAEELINDGGDDEAVCYGHRLDKKGMVHMELRWKDTGDESLGKVGKVMGSNQERRELGATWIAYCDRSGYRDDLFRMKGMARVELVKSHEWDDDGRPVAEVQWKHGEVGRVVVVDTLEKRSDNNRFRGAWLAYCESIGAKDEGFQKGYVDKERRKRNINQSKKVSKKRRY
jgi:hypothetical protein